MSQTEALTSPPPFAPIVKAGAFVALTAALCRLASVGKEFYVAYVLGAGLATDAYALVMLIPSLSMALLVQAMRSAFLTMYPEQAVAGSTQAQSFANRFLRELLLAASLAAVVGFAIAWLMWPALLSFASDDLVRASRPLLLPAAGLVIATAAVAALTAVLNAHGRFSLPQSTAVLPTIVVVLVLATWGRTGGGWALVGGLLAGTILQTGVLVTLLYNAGHRFGSGERTATGHGMWRLALPVIAVSVLSQINVYVDRTMASSLESGAVAVLAWSGMLRDLVAGTLIGGFISVLLPHFSTLAARGSAHEVGASCQLILRMAAVFLFPLTALIVVCVPLLAQHLAFGRFDERDATLLAGCVAAYSFGFFADMASNALFQGLLSLRRLRVLLWLSLFASFLPNIVLNLLLIRPLGAAGLALATSLVGYLTLIANYLTLRRLVQMKNESAVWTSVVTSLTYAVVASVLAYAAAYVARQWLTDGSSASVWAALIGGLVLTTSYLVLALVFPGSRDARRLLQLLRALRRR